MISVVIPVYNHAHTLEVCLSSIINQTYGLFEIIIVNDGSTDDFEEVIKDILKKEDFRVKISKVITEENKGAPAARNTGFKEVRGEFVIFMDADTSCHPKMFQEMQEVLEKNLQASFAYSKFRFGWKKIKSQKFDAEDLKKNNYIDTTSLIRAKDFPDFDESLKRFQDWDLWLTMLEQGKTGVFVDKVLYKKIVRGRKGMSNWLPSFMYKLPWKTEKVKDYEAAKEIVIKKHHLK